MVESTKFQMIDPKDLGPRDIQDAITRLNMFDKENKRDTEQLSRCL